MGQVVRATYYARVSTGDQAKGTSFDAQARIREAARRPWLGTRRQVRRRRTLRHRRHPPRMVSSPAGARAGDYEAVVVAQLDRCSCRASDVVHETDRLDELRVAFEVVKENPDMSTPVGRMVRTMLAGVAEFERDTIVSRPVDGQRAKARLSGWPGG